MNYQRRDFLKLTGTLAVTSMAGKEIFSSFFNNDKDEMLKSFGLQLYTLRDDLPKDPKGILKQVADAGYKQIESFEGSKGMFWGMTNTEFKKYMDNLGMKIVSSHCDISKDFEKKANEASAIGMKYLICAWMPPQKIVDEYKKTAEQFNQAGEICKKAGIRFAYHNHNHDFNKVEGKIAEDIYLENTDPKNVDFEMDIYWVVAANQDPEAWMKKYSHRFRLCHVKDRAKSAVGLEGFCDLGDGSINYSKVLKTAKQNGMEYFIVEQEGYPNTTPLKAMAVDAEYLKKLKI